MNCPACPINPNHTLNNEPEGVWCEQCQRYFQWKELSQKDVAEEWD